MRRRLNERGGHRRCRRLGVVGEHAGRRDRQRRVLRGANSSPAATGASSTAVIVTVTVARRRSAVAVADDVVNESAPL